MKAQPVPPASRAQAGEQPHPHHPAWASSFVIIFESKTSNARISLIARFLSRTFITVICILFVKLLGGGGGI